MLRFYQYYAPKIYISSRFVLGEFPNISKPVVFKSIFSWLPLISQDSALNIESKFAVNLFWFSKTLQKKKKKQRQVFSEEICRSAIPNKIVGTNKKIKQNWIEPDNFDICFRVIFRLLKQNFYIWKEDWALGFVYSILKFSYCFLIF